MKTALVLTLCTAFLAGGFILGHRVVDPGDLRHRLSALESAIKTRPDRAPYVASLNLVRDRRPNPPAIDAQAMTAQKVLAERIAVLERKLSAYTVSSPPAAHDDPEQIERAFRSEESLEQGFTILDHAEDRALLDEAMQEELTQLLPEMDKEANKQFWQRFFAALDAGTIELPAIEQTAEAWPRERAAKELTLEAPAW
jgi:hypothetical protein